MTTMNWSLTGRKSLLGIIGEKLAGMTHRTRAFLTVLLRFVLVAAGLGFISAGIWAGAGMWAGLISIGVSLMTLEWAVKR